MGEVLQVKSHFKINTCKGSWVQVVGGSGLVAHSCQLAKTETLKELLLFMVPYIEHIQENEVSLILFNFFASSIKLWN